MEPMGRKTLTGNESGFTLVELMWASALTVLILGALFAALRVGMTGDLLTGKRVQATDQGMTSMRLMEKYVRQAMVLSLTENYRIDFSVPRADDSNVLEDLSFRLVNGKLYYYRRGSGRVICENVRNQELSRPVFRYFNRYNAEIRDPSLRRSETTKIQLYLIIDDDMNRTPAPVELVTEVSLRNFNI